jgi:hypothetical protein
MSPDIIDQIIGDIRCSTCSAVAAKIEEQRTVVNLTATPERIEGLTPARRLEPPRFG